MSVVLKPIYWLLKLWGEAASTQLLWPCKMEAARKQGWIYTASRKDLRNLIQGLISALKGRSSLSFLTSILLYFRQLFLQKLSSLFSLKEDWSAVELCWDTALTELYELLIEKPCARLTACINCCNYIVFRGVLLVTSAWGSGARAFSEADGQHVTAVFPTCCAVLLTVGWGKYLGLEIPYLDFEEIFCHL